MSDALASLPPRPASRAAMRRKKAFPPRALQLTVFAAKEAGVAPSGRPTR